MITRISGVIRPGGLRWSSISLPNRRCCQASWPRG